MPKNANTSKHVTPKMAGLGGGGAVEGAELTPAMVALIAERVAVGVEAHLTKLQSRMDEGSEEGWRWAWGRIRVPLSRATEEKSEGR